MQAEEQWLALLEEQPLRFAIVHSKMADGQYMYVDCSGLSTLCVKDSSKKRRERTRFLSLRSDELLSGRRDTLWQK